MKNFQSYKADKYTAQTDKFVEVEDGIYKTVDPYGIHKGDIYVTSLTFELEPERYGEDEGSPEYIPQVPFEDMLDEFGVYVTDFYEDLNKASDSVCYQEFGSAGIDDIRKLRGLIGKKYYAEVYEKEGNEYIRLVTE